MSREEKMKLIENELLEKYKEYFKKVEQSQEKDEVDSNRVSKEFYNEIQEYIKQRKKELNID